jgi:hypothetical protein
MKQKSHNDDILVRVLNCDDFVLKGVYHNGFMTKYLLKSSPKNEQKQDSDLSSNEIAFSNSEALNLVLYLPAAAIGSPKESLSLKTRFDIPWPR